MFFAYYSRFLQPDTSPVVNPGFRFSATSILLLLFVSITACVACQGLSPSATTKVRQDFLNQCLFCFAGHKAVQRHVSPAPAITVVSAFLVPGRLLPLAAAGQFFSAVRAQKSCSLESTGCLRVIVSE